MRPLPPTNAELRVRYAPLRTWGALSAVGIVITLLRRILYGVPFFPIRMGLTPFLTLTALGALYAVTVLGWLALRRLYVR